MKLIPIYCKFFLKALCLLLLIIGCGMNRQYETYDGINVGNFTLTAENHPHGKGQSTCFYCHVIGNFHRVQRGNSATFDMQIIYNETPSYTLDRCYGCHCSGGGFEKCP